MKIPQLVRDQFEDYAYTQYERARMSQALQGVKVRAKLDRKQYLERDGDGYKNEAPSVLWVGWKLCLDAMAPTLEAATMWRQWAEVQKRVHEQLPEGYAVMLCMHRESGDGEVPNSYIDLIDAEGNMIEYADPEDMATPGSLFRIIDSALSAAKAHAALKLN